MEGNQSRHYQSNDIEDDYIFLQKLCIYLMLLVYKIHSDYIVFCTLPVIQYHYFTIHDNSFFLFVTYELIFIFC